MKFDVSGMFVRRERKKRKMSVFPAFIDLTRTGKILFFRPKNLPAPLLRQIDGLAAENPGVFLLGVFVGNQDRLLRGAEIPALQKLADDLGIIAQCAADKQVADEFVGHAEGGGHAAGQNFCALPFHHERDEKLAEVVGDGIRLLGFGVADDINRIFRKDRHGFPPVFPQGRVFALLDVFLRVAANSSVRRRELRKFVRY